MKPYFIYNNDQMKRLIETRPRSMEELREISGFGEVKCQKYGADILRIISENN